ncbi:MAG: hypothetical protein VYC12_07080 [Candidatus Thermoplasmatota archaeon]|jgi:hypothetical protein|nr:hypothetical protein [Candidatus Thermoplasmatota archaeon]
MGAGGAAPPVKSEDVMILIGSTILLTMLVIQAWSTPVSLNCNEEGCDYFEVKYDLSEGDVFTLEVKEGEVRPTVILPDESSDFIDNKDAEWEYKAETSGVHTFNFSVEEDSVIDYSVSRGIIIDYGLYPIGALILAFGILKRISKETEDEPMEGLLED